ncbi:hypothetical protein LX97_00106 [Nonlabens dokdonensis]|uniref:Uncharacterized protein n=2 Tax=Nonlabens dokdonensis TaxID=328515 RepID=L7W972_NONDD|nr:hypothetical protein DDD_0281 [Nonlabens dokdonensis DSW-6]PZX43107.1 hypothetical protein LX97_00106 [Nonlabens dokdonensis]
MSQQNKSTFWRLRNEKHFFFLLPYYGKIIGIVIAIAGFSSMLILHILLTELDRIALLNKIFYSCILLGLIMISFSKDKFEDERIANLRFRSLSFSLGWVAILFVTIPLITMLSDLFFTDLNYENGIYDGLPIFIIFINIAHLIYFYIFKRDL